MRSKKLVPWAIGFSLLLLAGCSNSVPSFDTISMADSSSETSEKLPAVPSVPESPIVATLPASTEETTTEAEAETSFITIDITTAEATKPTSGNGRMEATNMIYEKNNIKINYPVLVGMSDEETQKWANDEIYKDVMSLLEYYKVDEEKDSFTLDYEVSTIYRGEFSLVYDGTFSQESSGYTIKVKAAEDLDLSTKKHIRLSDRLSATKLIKCVLGDDEYEIVNSGSMDDTLKKYLEQQKEEFYKDILESADFGGSKQPEGCYSYNYMGNVAIVIPLPHMMNDYVVISIKQQTK